VERIFAIFSEQRCGSHLLRAYLNDHPEIYCAGELARRDRRFSRRSSGERSLEDVLHGDPHPIHSDRELRIPRKEDARRLGFLLKAHQLSTANRRACSDANVLWICLGRRNLLRRLLSLKVAQTTREFLARPARPPRVRIGLTELLEDVERVERNRAWAQTVLKPRLTIWYEDLCTEPERVLARVQSLLDVEVRELRNEKTMRLETRPLSDAILDFQPFARGLRATRYSSWLDPIPGEELRT
jgi:hypothetical protein